MYCIVIQAIGFISSSQILLSAQLKFNCTSTYCSILTKSFSIVHLSFPFISILCVLGHQHLEKYFQVWSYTTNFILTTSKTFAGQNSSFAFFKVLKQKNLFFLLKYAFRYWGSYYSDPIMGSPSHNPSWKGS